MNKTTLSLTMTLALALLLGGCMRVPPMLSKSYHPSGPVAGGAKLRTLVVVKPVENRPYGGESRLGWGIVAVIPGIPYGVQHFTPERYYYVNSGKKAYDFRKDLGETIAADLQAAGIAERVVYVDDPKDYTPQGGGKELVLRLKLNEGEWHRYWATYGLSIFVTFSYIYGIPISFGHATLSVEATLEDTGGNKLGQQVFTGQMPVLETLYARTMWFMDRMPLVYGQISPRLRAFAGQGPAVAVSAARP